MQGASRATCNSVGVDFPVSGVDISPVVPLVIGFLIASCTTPAGVSGAFLLLPFQVSVLGFTAPGVTPTNLLYNVFSTPGAILSYRRMDGVDWTLIRAIFLGTGPAVVIGSILRVTVFNDPASFKYFAGAVLLILGMNLVGQAALEGVPQGNRRRIGASWIPVLGAGAGLIGGIYGISGGSIIAPVLVAMFRIPVKRVAPAALISTLFTSIAGVVSFHVLAFLGSNGDAAGKPDWLLGLLFAAGGAAGGFLGAHINSRSSEKWLRVLLGGLAFALGVSYLQPLFS